MRYVIVLIFSVLVMGCDEVSPKAKSAPPVPEQTEDIAFSGIYLKDGEGGLFNNVKWYYYSLINHVVWGLYDVYSIKTPNMEYRIQIVDYYGGADEAGQFVVRVQWTGGDTLMAFEAKGCGNTYTNPDFAVCMADPNQNVFTYLDLDTLSFEKMRDDQALLKSDWDMAFKGTDVKLNSGLSGPSTVVGALVYRFPFFFDNGTPSDTAVTVPELQGQAKSDFLTVPAPTTLQYFLPDGLDRVMHETFWYEELASGVRSVRDQNWWIVQSHDAKYFAKLRVQSLSDAMKSADIQDGYTSAITLQWFVQDEGASGFSQVAQTWSEDLSTSVKTLSLCLNLKTGVSAKCSSSDRAWDLKLVALNVFKDGKWSREWRFFTSNGAIGPLSSAEASATLSAP